MAYSKASTVKYVKAIGTYDEAELADVLTQIDDGDAKLLYELTRKVHNKLKSTRTEAVEGKKLESKKKSQKMSPAEKLHRIIQRIEHALDKYESNVEIDNWNVSFIVGEYYGNKTFEQIKDIHNKLVNSGLSVEKLKLLNLAERGRLYDFLKNSDERHGSWSNICKELSVCRRTVDRYIDFFNIIEAYPRLIICELSFELIVSTYNQLHAYLNDHDCLSARLKIPLKQTRLLGGGIFSSRRMPGGGEDLHDAPEQLHSEGAFWNVEWQLADELFDDE
jgi:uncharacterized FlaG/YvyC family protein